MTSLGKWKPLELAVCIAIMLHLLLFMAVRSPNHEGLSGPLTPPKTHYLGTSSDRPVWAGGNVRTVWSPVLFSLPSKMGFSRELLNGYPKLSQTLSGPSSDLEPFLAVDLGSASTGAQLIPQELLISEKDRLEPQLPSESSAVRPVANRIYVAPELKERLLGGVVLPLALNKATSIPWEVRADISVSKQGQVRHVLLEQPLESAGLNQEVIRLLYGLRFISTTGPVEGQIEIYSPAPIPTEGANP